jgi:hypothetical protein
LPEFSYLERPRELPVRLLFQRLLTSDPAQPVSAHADLACDDIARLADRHVEAGARVVARYPYWVTMIDPAGREYCLTSRDPETGRRL